MSGALDRTAPSVPSARAWRLAGLAVLVAIPLLATAIDATTERKVIKDEVQHLAYLRSLALDRDLDFTDDFAELWPKWKKHRWTAPETGRPPNTAALGAPLVWLPGFVIAHASGSAAAERASCVFVSAALFSVGVWLAFRMAHERFGALAAALGTAFVAGASFFFYWWLYPGLYAHAPAIGVTTLFVFTWWRGLGRAEPRRWAVLGLLGGFLTVMRWQNVWLPFTCGAVELVFVLLGWLGGETGIEGVRAPAERLPAWARWRRVVVCGLVYAVTTFVGLAPQLLAWKAIYGDYLPQTGGRTFLRWLDPYAMDLLFSPRYGLLGFSPWLYVPVAGLGVAAVRFRREPLWLVAGLYTALAVYLNACLASVSWYGGATFGPRRLDSLFPFLVLGGAYAADRLIAWWRRAPAVPLAALGLAGILWTSVLAGSYRGETINVGMVGAERFPWQASGAFLDRLGWPPSWPAEAWYSLTRGLRWGQYTQLAGADPVPFGDGKIDLSRPDRRHLGEGWTLVDGAPTLDAGSGPSAPSGDVYVYLMDLGLRESALAVRIAFSGAPPTAVNLGGRALDGTVTSAPDGGSVWRAVVPDRRWRAGVNRLTVNAPASAEAPWRVVELRIEKTAGAGGDD